MLAGVNMPQLRASALALCALVALSWACSRAPEQGVADQGTRPATEADTTEPAAPEGPPATPRQETRSAVPADINEAFLDTSKPVEEWSARWEVESREVFACRDQIVAALGLKPGERVADIGTGTGLFLGPLSRAVGDAGKVFAVDIAQKFVDHVRKRAVKEEMPNVVAVLSNERSAELAAGSVDVVLLCDTYHHFEYHEDMLRSIRSALRPGGRLVVVDFARIPGKSREWILGHVRAGQEVVTAEIDAAGFRFIDEVEVDGFEENYLVRFERE
jgi:predicted methyltransferase